MQEEREAERFRERFDRVREEVARVMVGQRELVELVLVALFARGNCLLEGVPGLGKTRLVRTLSDVLGLSFRRIQFTPDLMPADVIGTHVVAEDDRGRRAFEFRKGPIFAHLVLADEINRATPKTQSALLEAMQERSVTVWGTTHLLEPPMFVLATQNPIEMEGTYPLPEAQVDRFLFKLLVARPSREELIEIVNRTTGPEEPRAARVMERMELLAGQELAARTAIAPHVVDYATRLVAATHPDDPTAPELVRKHVRFGASPRAAQALVLGAKVLALLDGRLNVGYRDLRRIAPAALRHRILTGYQAQVDLVTGDLLVAQVLEKVPERT